MITAGSRFLAEGIADKDLSLEVDVASEKDALGGALRGMTHSLDRFVRQVGGEAEQVASGSIQVAKARQSLS
jgi:methyl-accepting chemotaxis protein